MSFSVTVLFPSISRPFPDYRLMSCRLNAREDEPYLPCCRLASMDLGGRRKDIGWARGAT